MSTLRALSEKQGGGSVSQEKEAASLPLKNALEEGGVETQSEWAERVKPCAGNTKHRRWLGLEVVVVAALSEAAAVVVALAAVV